ncbi:ABC transporter substrate-binding protein [Actinomadura algeriensis]|uniref:Peptide/nickel transport system substrate-binding protein n=1 Tax=Actinomadura algeriensis TaxID=1679523 RepID=A0ABR9JJZ1_9ACTN|nr:ABC transporter substrate-binding protein [Actinomadura algeriensis]MBE1530833.1 peptide/nickel transport system substrate-binding protein [Actinomadura algeriensis]
MQTFASRRFRHAAGILAVATAATACAWQSGGGTVREDVRPAEYRVGMIGKQPGGTPVDGGTLTVAAYAEAGLLDPAETIVAGTTGGIEMAAIYDVLMRWDPESGDVVPQLAKSLESADDDTTWTLGLRDGVRFSDGTELDAAAVKWSLERYVSKGADEAALWKENVRTVKTPDDRTVVFELARSWPSFSFMLTSGPGMIVAKSSDKGEKFEPVGAGPFTFERYAPDEEMVLKANERYRDGRPHLDRVRLVYVDDPDAALATLDSGRIQGAVLRDPVIVQDALKAGYSGYLNMVSLGNSAVINATPGHPGADPRVRKAMHLAVQPEVIYRRAYPGTGLASNALFPEFSRWHTDVEPLPYDPEAARELLAEAKADGYDGKVTWLDAQDPASRTTALAAKAMLENVGFDVELDLVRSIADQITKVSVKKTYDVSGWGISWREAGPFARMYATLHAKGNFTVGMATTPEMSALIEELRGADGEEKQRAVMGRIQEQWNKDVPALALGPQPELIAWPDRVRGVTGTVNSMVLLDDAWLARN